MEKEIWKPIKGFDNYLISSFGRIKSLHFRKEKIIKLQKDGHGYFMIYMQENRRRKRRWVHRLVAQTFCLNKNPKINKIIHHIDKDITNNNYNNLKWVTYKENNHGSYKKLQIGQLKKWIKFINKSYKKKILDKEFLINEFLK